MLRSVRAALLVVLGGCGFSLSTGTSIDATGSDGSGSGSDGDIGADDMTLIDAPMTDGSSVTTWMPPQVLGFIGAEDPTLTGDMLQIWFEQNGEIFHASRPSTGVAFGPAEEVVELSPNTSAETTPEVTSDGLTMTFGRLIGNNDIYLSAWDSSGMTWTAPDDFGAINTTDHDQAAAMSDDRTMVYFTRAPLAGASDIYVSKRPSPSSAAWSNPSPAIELNSIENDGDVFLSGNKLTVCFASNRSGSAGVDIYCATRASATVPFDAPVRVPDINSPQTDQDPWLSPDGKVMIFWSDRDGTGKLWYAVRS